MRTILLLAVLGCTIVFPCLGQQNLQQKTSVSVLLVKLRSNEGGVREQAYEQLKSDPTALRNTKVKAALLDLLDRENHELDSQLIEAQKKGYPDEGDNAGWAEYYSDLLGAVDSFADWNDPRQACILVGASSSDDSAFAAEIANHAKATIPCLMKRSESAIAMNRAVTVPVLVQALAKAKDSLDPGTLRTVKRTIVNALSDTDEGVRAFTVDALGKYGTNDMIPKLRIVSETDPSPEVQGHSIRKSAAAAIVAIQKRAGQH